MCESERETEGGRGRESERRWRSWMCTIGLDMNAPQHSFPHIPFNFNSLIELATLLHALREAFWLTHPFVCKRSLPTNRHRKTTANEQTCKKKKKKLNLAPTHEARGSILDSEFCCQENGRDKVHFASFVWLRIRQGV